MPQIAATITDVADIRAYECLLPDCVSVSRLAMRLAELAHFPVVGPDSYPLKYGLVVKGGPLLDPDATLAGIALPREPVLRLVPEITAGIDEIRLPDDPDFRDDTEVAEKEDFDLSISVPIALIHDAELGVRPDVRIDAEVHREIDKFAREDRHTECAGLLLGIVEEEDKGRVIRVKAIAPAELAVGTRTSIRLTLEAWEDMLRIRDNDYPDMRVLGWFHTHAGWGVFMSESDVFIHRHFFPHPNMIAYVLDPTTGRDGFFYWHEGKIGLCPNYGIVSTSDAEQSPRKQNAAAKTRTRDLKDWVIAALVLVLIAIVAASLKPHNKSPQQKGGSVSKMTPVVVTQVRGSNSTVLYTIGSRDNPWSICNKHYHDGGLSAALMRYNGLEPRESLHVGQQIKLPPERELRKLDRR